MKRSILLLVALALCLASMVAAKPHARPPSVVLHEDPRATLTWVAHHMNVALRDDVPLAAIRLASATPLARFQDAVSPQWGVRPGAIYNVYVLATNEIYLDDQSDYYARRDRTLDESLAHELAHYLQARYLGDDLASDAAESGAVAVQQSYSAAHPRLP